MSWTGLEYDQRVSDMSLIAIWAYHCNRCNYVWLPKDLDIEKHDGKDLINREPPKSCARCKSKYWNCLRKNIDDDRLPSSMKRFHALIRQGEYLKAIEVRPEYRNVIIKEYNKIRNKAITAN